MFLSGFEWFLSVSECSLSGLVRFWVVLVGSVLVLSGFECSLGLGLGYIDKCEEWSLMKWSTPPYLVTRTC